MLIGINYEVDRYGQDIVDSNGAIVTRINGPAQYIYHLTYVSLEPMLIDNFPVNVNDHFPDRVIGESPIKRSPIVKLEKVD